MGISIGIKSFEYPDWVTAVYDCLSEEDRANIVKTDIYSACNFSNESKYEIIPFVAGLSNRVKKGHNAESCAVAIIIAEGLYPWHYLPGNEIQQWKCKHCNHEFTTRNKDPRCESCKKWNWQDLCDDDDDTNQLTKS